MSKAIKFKNKNNEPVYPCPYYPVGSVYISFNNTDPSTFFGGTWERIKDKFLLSAGDKYSAGNTGGEEAHKLTIAEMPSHNHQQRVQNVSGYGGADGQEAGTGWGGSYHYANWSQNTGGNKAHNICHRI